MSLIAGALVLFADLAAQAVRSLAAAKDRSVCSLLALQKLEQLRASPFRPADTPAGVLDRDTPGSVEYLDAQGRIAGQAAGHEGTVYVRRWSVRPFRHDSRVTVIQVRAGRCRLASQAGHSCEALAHDSRLSTACGEAW